MIVITLMVIPSVATQTPIHEYFGVEGCYFFWTVNCMYLVQLAVGGIGMAALRLICFHYLFKKEINTNQLMKRVLLSEKVLAIICFSMLASGVLLNGWETAILYQFCMNLGPVQAQVLHNYAEKEYNHFLVNSLRVGAVFFGQVIITGELVIYLWLLYHLRLHDVKTHQEGVITAKMVSERKRKNVITLYGQITSFVVEIVLSIYIMIHVSFNQSIVDPSVFPISNIVSFTIVALAQFFTSHDMRRFVKETWDFAL